MDGHAGEGHMDMDSQASGKRGWMAGFDCDEREERRFNLAHHHQLTYEPILHHHDRLCNRFQVTKSRFSGELRRCCRAPMGFVFCGLSLRRPANGAAPLTPLPSVLS